MRPGRFDTRLQFVFTALSAITLAVGLASMGVNRHLINTYGALLDDTMPAVQLAERVGADAEMAWGAADRLRGAESEDEIGAAADQLRKLIEGIGNGMQALRPRQGKEGAGDDTQRSREHAERMRAGALEAHAIRAALGAAEQRVDAAAPRLAAIVSAQNDLARLRITTGLSELYTARGLAIRQGLDRLADRDFFAYERIGELSEATAELGRGLRRIAAAQEPGEIEALRPRLAGDLARARARLSFLPSPGARAAAASELDAYAAALGADGLLSLRLRLLEAQAALAAVSVALDRELNALTSEAQRLRDLSHATTLERIAAVSRLSFLLGSGLALATALAVVAGAFIWLYARRRIVGRLGAIAGRIVRVAQNDFGEPAAITGPDEIGRVEKAFNVLRRRALEAARLRDHLLTKPLSPRALAALLTGEAPASDSASDPAAGDDDALVLRLGEDAADLGAETAGAILAGYLQDLPTAVAAIRQARTAQDRRKAAHRLKGASANFGLEALCDLLRRIEAGEATALDELEAAAARADSALRTAAPRAGLHLVAGTAKQ